MKNMRLIMRFMPTAIVAVISLYFIFGYQPGDLASLFNRQQGRTTQVITGTIDVGTKVEIARQSIDSSGGIIKVIESTSPLYGLQINVPDSSYAGSRMFQISYASVNSHTFGKNFNPISPLIIVENGGDYSDEIMLAKIPVRIPDGHFALAFFYDSNSGQLEGVPLVTEDKDSITVATRHFSNMIISSIEEYRLKGVAKSGFLPGFDDWQFPNEGSYLEPWGHCSGQSLTAMWYYAEKFLKGKSQLYGLYDNNGNEKTTKIWQDDTLAYRLASMVQKDYDDRWAGPVAGGMKEWTSQLTDAQQMDAFAYSILATGHPQFVYIADNTTPDGPAHAMIVYQVLADGLAVADPNYHGVARKIKFENGRFVTYSSGDVTYNRVYWMAGHALVEWPQIALRWSEMERKTIGKEEFPDYTLLAIEQDGTEREIKDGFTTDKSTLTIEAIGGLVLGISIYRDGAWLPKDANGNLVVDTMTRIPLEEGPNKLGIWVCARIVNPDASAFWTWLDFRWLTVTYNPTTEPEPPTEISLDKVAVVGSSITAKWVPNDLPIGEGDGSYFWEGFVTLDFGGISLPAGTWLTLIANYVSDEPDFKTSPGGFSSTVELKSTGPVHQVKFEFSVPGKLYFQKNRPSPPGLRLEGLHLTVNTWEVTPTKSGIYKRDF